MRILSQTILAGLLLAGLAATGAQAGGHHGYYYQPLVNAPLAYDPFWKLKNPGGPVEINPQPLPPRQLRTSNFFANSAGAKVSFNPQPDPPGDY